jgi:cell division protein FtsZ
MELQELNYPPSNNIGPGAAKLPNASREIVTQGDRSSPVPLTLQDLSRLREGLQSEAHRLQNFSPRYIRVNIDGDEVAFFSPQATACEPFMIPISTSFMEILGEDDEGELLLAFVALTQFNPLRRSEIRELVSNAGGIEITIRVSTVTDQNNESLNWRIQIDCVNTKVLRANEPCAVHDFYPEPVRSTDAIALTTGNPVVKILVVGVGSSGNNAIDHMLAGGVKNATFAAFNTDVQALQRSRAPIRFQLGGRAGKGRGTGADVSLGREVALNDSEEIIKVLDGTDMVFITTGLGGGTGTGAAPVIAALAMELGILTVGVVTTPFGFEGSRRYKQAQHGLANFRQSVDALITIHNDSLLKKLNRTVSLKESFTVIDDVLKQALTSIIDLLVVPGLINIDFADLRTIMSGTGSAFFGTGTGYGEARSLASVQEAMSSSLLDRESIGGARGVLVNITGGPDLTLHEVNEAATIVREIADIDANIIFGAIIDESLADEMRVTIVATGLEQV